MHLHKLAFHIVAALPLAIGIAANGHAQVPGIPFVDLQHQINDVNARLNATESAVAPLQQQINDEAAARQAGDAASRAYTDSTVGMEASARSAADADLQQQISALGGSNTGSGGDGSLTISTNATIDRPLELHLTDFTVNPGITLTIDAAIIIRVSGPVNINGNIVVAQAAAGGTVTVGGAFGLDAGGNGNGLGAGNGGTNSNAAGGGGGNAGRGGAGQFSGGGKAYPYRLQPWGSGGGAGQTTTTGSAGNGGWGGGSLIIVARGAVSMNGAQITADGSDGGAASNGGGGGSGGTIGIFSETSIDAAGVTLAARGGNGGTRGGGGGGGYIVLVAPSVSAALNEAVDTAGGAGFQNGGNGKVIVRNEAPRFWAL